MRKLVQAHPMPLDCMMLRSAEFSFIIADKFGVSQLELNTMCQRE